MKKIILLLCFIFAFNLFEISAQGDSSSLTLQPFYVCDFSSHEMNSAWTLKNGSCTNKWRINIPSSRTDTCLFVSRSTNDTTYANSYATVVAMTNILMPSDDSIVLSLSLNIKGETSYDYLKVFLSPLGTSFTPSNSSSHPSYAGTSYSVNAFKFNTGRYYFSNLSSPSIITAKAYNPTPCDSARLVFVWVNDNSGSHTLATIIDSIVLYGQVLNVYDTICEGDTLSLSNRHITSPGAYLDTNISSLGCNSVVNHIVTMMPKYLDTLYDTICQGELYSLSNGMQVNISGMYRDEAQTIYGCDSVTIVCLTVKDTFSVLKYDTICSNEWYDDGNFHLNAAGYYYDTLQTIFGCDSIINLCLAVNNVYDTTINAQICNGEAYEDNGFVCSIAGTYTDSLTTIQGCDSVITLNLMVYSFYATNLYDTICQGETYNNNGFNVSQEGIYTDSLQSVIGCDSIVTLYLTVHPTDYLLDTSSITYICPEDTFFFGDIAITSQGQYFDTLRNMYGCDSILGVNLVYYTSPADTIYDTIGGGETYNFYGTTLSSAGIYYDTIEAEEGCDTIVTLYLAAKSSLQNVENKNSITIYPNPASENITLYFENMDFKVEIFVFDEEGKGVFNALKKEDINTMNLSLKSLSNGVYTIVIKSAYETTNKKIIIIK